MRLSKRLVVNQVHVLMWVHNQAVQRCQQMLQVIQVTLLMCQFLNQVLALFQVSHNTNTLVQRVQRNQVSRQLLRDG